MLYTCSYIFFLMAASKMISFNEQHKNLSLQKIFYLHCVCIFSLSYIGGGGGGLSLSIKARERCIKFSISIPILIISEFVCALV